MAQANVVAKVVFVAGEAYARNGSGQLRRLHAGDVLREGETVSTRQGAEVQIAFEDGRDLVLRANENLFLDAEVAAVDKPDAHDSALPDGGKGVDRILQALDQGGDLDDVLEAPAAGAAGAGGDEGHSFVRLLRIAEGVDPLSFEFGTSNRGVPDTIVGAPVTRSVTAGTETELAVSLTATPHVTEGGVIVYTATLNAAANVPVTLTLSNGAAIVIPAGAVSGTASVPARADDVYANAGDVSVTITSASGGFVPSPVPAVTHVADDGDVTTVSLSATPNVVEGGAITYTATLSNPAATAVTVTLSNGAVITIAAGSSSGSVAVAAPGDDVYIDAGSVSATILTASGGGFEALVVDATPATTAVADDSDVTSVTLTASPAAVEGGVITYTATLGSPALSPVTVTLSNGAMIAIAAGDTAGSVNVAAPGDDVYIDAGNVHASIVAAVGGGFEALAINPAAAVTTITDTPDVTTVSLAASPTAMEGGAITYTATLDNVAQAPVVVTLDNGAIINIAAGDTTGSITVGAPTDDVYVDAGNVGVAIASASGGNFESLAVNGAVATTAVTDTPDVTTVSLAGPGSVLEGGAATYTISLTSPAQAPVTVNIAYSGTAADGSDYTGVASVVIPAGASSASFNVATLNDALAERAETLSVSITGASGGNFEALAVSSVAGNVTTVIVDDDTPTLSVSDVSVVEGSGAVFTVSLSNPSAVATTFTPSLTSGTAVVGSDTAAATNLEWFDGATWQPVTGDVTIPAGAVSVQLRLATIDDALHENSEAFVLTATVTGGLTANLSAAGIATILDNDPQPALSIGDVTVNEAAGTATFTVTLSAAAGLPVTVAYASGDNTAVAGADYVAVSGVLTFAPGVTSQTITVPILEDSVYEGNEGFVMTLSSPTNATIADGTGVGTIVDNDIPTVTVSNPTVTEGADPYAVFTISLSNPSTQPVTLGLATVNLTAAGSGIDYGPAVEVSTDGGATWAAAGSATLAAGQTSLLARTAIVDDNIHEAAETFRLTANVTGGTTVNASAFGVATIIDNDSLPTVIIGDVMVNEGAGTATFTVVLSNPSSGTVTVDFNTGNGTATAGSDFTAAGGTLSFAPGVTTQTIVVPITNDAVYEGPETFQVNLVNPSNATLADAQGLGTIVDDGTGAGGSDDDRPSVASVSNPTTVEGGHLDFTVTLSNPSTTATAVTLGTASGTASKGIDFAAGGQVSFDGGLTWAALAPTIAVPAGAGSFLVRISTVNDTISESAETMTLSAATAQNAVPVVGTGTITDNDGTPILAIDGPALVNEAAGTVTYTVILSNASAVPVTVNYATADGSATAGSDYTATSGTLTFAPGETSKTLTVAITNDTVYEGNETYSIALSAPTNATLANGSVTTTIADDGTGSGGSNDDRPSVASVSNPTTVEGGHLDFTVTLSNPSTTATAVTLGTASGTASKGIDFAAGGQVSFDGGLTWAALAPTIAVPAGAGSFLVRIPTVNDTISESAETMTLSAATAQDAVPVVGTGTITDNDGTPSLSLNDITVNEAAGTATFTVTLSNPSAVPVTVNYATADGSATAGADYTAASGTLTFAPGVITQTVTVAIANDGIYEGSETFTVNLSTPSNATIADAQGLGTIRDDGSGAGGTDNDTPSLAVSSPTLAEGAGYAQFTVSLSNPSAQATTVSLSLANGTATSPADYAAALEVSTDGGATWMAATTATFAPGATSLLVRTPVTDDLLAETTETFTLTATTTAGVTANPSALGAATIIDNDHVPIATADAETSPEDTIATGNVLANDIDADGNTLAVTQFVVNGVTYAADATANLAGIGALTLNGNGTYSFVPALNWSGSVPQVSYTVTDGANLATSTLDITVTPVNDAPTVGTLPAANVSEEGLAGALPDSTGTSDTTNATVATGNLNIVDPDSSAFAITLTAPAVALTSQGVAVTWSGGAPGTDLVGAAGGKEVLRIHVTSGGAYTVTLSAPVDHATTGAEDVKTLNFGVSVSDGALSGSTTLVVNIEDDAPFMGSQHQAVVLPPQDTNLMIVLDISGSMTSNVTINGVTMTRLQAAVEAVDTLLDSYSAFGNVAVRLVTFSTSAAAHGSTWESVASVKSYLATLAASGGTNYDAALGIAETAFTAAGKIAGAQNVSYFLTDGLPTYGAGSTSQLAGTRNGSGSDQSGSDTGIQASEENNWTAFLNTNDINSFAIAMGGPFNSTNSYDGQTHTSQYYIDPIAYNGVGAGANTNGTIVTDWTTLSSTLAATVAAPASGQILSGNALGTGWGIGADGGFIQSVGIDGNTYAFNANTGAISASGGSYSYNNATHQLTVNTSHGGVLAVDMDSGDYTYQANATMTNAYSETLNVTLQDRDGDSATGTLTLDVARAMGGVGNDVIIGTSAADVIIGGRGGDTLTGGSGADTFRWVLGDATGSPTDTVTDFSTATPASGGDILDLRDLLVGESHLGSDAGNLANYLHFSYAGGNTTVSVSSHDSAATTQTIVLQGVNLVGAFANDQQVIQDLLTKGKLITD